MSPTESAHMSSLAPSPQQTQLLKRTTSSFCIPPLATQQSTLQRPKVSFAPIVSTCATTSSRSASHSRIGVLRRAPSPDAKRVASIFSSVSSRRFTMTAIRQSPCSEGEEDDSSSPPEECPITSSNIGDDDAQCQKQERDSPCNRNRSASTSSLSTSSSSSSSICEMNRSFSSSSTASTSTTTSASMTTADDDVGEGDNEQGEEDEDDKFSVTSFTPSNTSRSSKHSATSTFTSFSSSRSNRHIFFLPPICDDEDEHTVIGTSASGPLDLRFPSSSSSHSRMRHVRTTTRKQGAGNKLARRRDPLRQADTSKSASLFPLADEPREELDALVRKIDRLAGGKDAFLELMVDSEEWTRLWGYDDSDSEEDEDGEPVSTPRNRVRTLKSSSRSISSIVGDSSSPLRHPVQEGEDPLTAVTPSPDTVVPVLERRRGKHSRSSSTASTSTITSNSSNPSPSSTPFSSFSSVYSPLQKTLSHLSATSSSSPSRATIEVETEAEKECELVTYLESRSAILPPSGPAISSSRCFTPISALISLPSASSAATSDRLLPKLRPMRFSTPWQHLSRTPVQRTLLAPRASSRARMGAKVIKDDQRAGWWGWKWGRMSSVFSEKRGTESFLPGAGDFLDMDDDDDDEVEEQDGESEEDEWDGDDDDDEDEEDEFFPDFNDSSSRSHSPPQRRSSDSTATPMTRPIDSFLLPDDVPLPPPPFRPYFSPSHPTITKRRYVHRTRQASDPLFHRTYAVENCTAMRRRIPPPRPFMDPELLARIRMRMDYYSSRYDCDDDRVSEEEMYGVRWRSEVHRIKLLDRHRPLYTLYGAWGSRCDGPGDVEEEVIREGVERKCEIGRWVSLCPSPSPGGGERLRIGSALRSIAFGAGAPDV